MHHDDFFLRDSPLIHQEMPRVVAVCDDASRLTKHSAAEPPQFACGSSQRELLTMRVAFEWDAGKLAGNQCEKAFRQKLAGVNDVGACPSKKWNEPDQRCGVLRAAAQVKDTPIRKRQGQSLDTERVRTIEGFRARGVSSCDLEIDSGEPTVELPHPPAAASRFGRKDLGEE
jgi:hypothetical protein